MQEIREQDPLKQGLKPKIQVRRVVCNIIREQDPLKQGLKLKSFDEKSIKLSNS